MNEIDKNPEDQHDIIYALRTAQQHHVQLSMFADQKANIILGAFLIFITISQSIVDKAEATYIPVLVFSVFFTLSAFFALMVIKPRFRDNKITPGAEPSNLLFFGSFLSLSQEDYVEALSDKLRCSFDARQMLMKDIYQIGEVLKCKYGNLRLSYICLALSVVSSLATTAVIQFI